MKVLSTRKLSPDAISFANSADLEIDCIDLVITDCGYVEFEPSQFQTVTSIVFTSVNAVNCFLKLPTAASFLKERKIFCTSGATQTALLNNGFPISGTAVNASLLSGALADDPHTKSVLHPCGQLVLPEIRKRMKSLDIPYFPLEVYNTSFADVPAIDKKYQAILFFSPSGIDSYLMNNILYKGCIYVCIGHTTADHLNKKNDQLTILVPEEPSPLSMLKILSDKLKQV